MRLHYTWAMILTAAWSSSLHAGLVTYDVNLSGISSGNGHLLQVTGTITAETDTNTLSESDLTFFHASDAGTALPSLPVSTGIGFAWDATATELRFERTSSVDTGAVKWAVGTIPFERYLSFGSGASEHRMYYFDPSHLNPPLVGADIVTLLPSGNAETPGYLVGTAIPETTPGDFNHDGICDGTDFLLWQRDRSVGLLSVWEANYGRTAGPATIPQSVTSSAVPEPATLLLGCVALIAIRRVAGSR